MLHRPGDRSLVARDKGGRVVPEAAEDIEDQLVPHLGATLPQCGRHGRMEQVEEAPEGGLVPPPAPEDQVGDEPGAVG